MSQYAYDPVMCHGCQEQPVADDRVKYCGKECADDAAKKQRSTAATKYHDKFGGHRGFHLKQRYGISIEQHDEMVKRQRSRCAICGRKCAKLHVDHDHETGRVRALLCRSCNTGLGKLGDSPERLREAAAYVERFK